MATEEQVTEALKNVYDPEIGINIVDLGLVYDLEVQDSSVNVDLTLTSMGCPAGPMIVQQIEEEIESVEGVEDVSVKIVWSPAWNLSMMSEDAKMELGYL